MGRESSDDRGAFSGAHFRHSLIVEPGTPFAEQKLDLPDEDTEREMYARTAEILAEYGFFQYEISNYAKPGFACRHNIGYWKRTDYLGFGPSAASLFGNRRWTNTADRSFVSESVRSTGKRSVRMRKFFPGRMPWKNLCFSAFE